MFLAKQYGEFFDLASHWLLSIPQVNEQRRVSVYEMAIENHNKREKDVGLPSSSFGLYCKTPSRGRQNKFHNELGRSLSRAARSSLLVRWWCDPWSFTRRHVFCVFGRGDLSIADGPTKTALARRESLRLIGRCTTG